MAIAMRAALPRCCVSGQHAGPSGASSRPPLAALGRRVVRPLTAARRADVSGGTAAGAFSMQVSGRPARRVQLQAAVGASAGDGDDPAGKQLAVGLTAGGAAGAGLPSLEQQLVSIDKQIRAVGTQIKSAAKSADGATSQAEKDRYSKREAELREEKKQLREEKRLLLLLLRPSPPPPLAESSRVPLDLACFRLAVPPSDAAKPAFRRQLQQGEADPGEARYDGLKHNPDDTRNPLLPDGHPLGFAGHPWVGPALVLPPALIHPVYGLFLDEVAARRIEPDDCELVSELVQEGPQGMPYLHRREAAYQEVLCKALGRYLHRKRLSVWPSTIEGLRTSKTAAASESTAALVRRMFPTDATVWDSKRRDPLCLIENKLSDVLQALFQLIAYYHEHYAGLNLRSPLRLADVCPLMGVESAGPILRVVALASTLSDHVVAAPLTPFLSLTNSLPSVGPLDHLAAVFGALRRSLVRLEGHYQRVRAELANAHAAEPPLQDRRAAELALPYPLRRPSAGIAALEDAALQARLLSLELMPGTAERLAAAEGKLLYLAHRRVLTGAAGEGPGPEPVGRVVVKFCMRPFAGEACEAVHRLWASRGLAPQLHGALRLPGGIDMVVMEHLDPADGWFALHSLPQSETSTYRRAALAALAAAHALRTSDGRATVHGDCRSNNIMVRRSSLPDGKPEPTTDDVRFIDFDWAGIDGLVRCPTFINPEARWPEGMATGAPLTQQLDCATLDLDPNFEQKLM